jgi:hypothetical protein
MLRKFDKIVILLCALYNIFCPKVLFCGVHTPK